METKYYSDLYIIDDIYRKLKYEKILLSSLSNDMNKWTGQMVTSGNAWKPIRYTSPNYNGSEFIIEVFTSGHMIAYIYHQTKPTQGYGSELISDNFSIDVKNAVKTLRENIYTPEIYEIEKLIGNKNDRKEKLENLEVIDLIDDTLQDWTNDNSENSAKLIAKLIYSYRRNEDIYKMWTDKFDEYELIMNELKNLKG